MRSDFWLPERREKKGELEKGSQKVQTSSCKRNKQKKQYDKYNQHCNVLYMKVAQKVNPKLSHHKKNFSISLTFYL